MFRSDDPKWDVIADSSGKSGFLNTPHPQHRVNSFVTRFLDFMILDVPFWYNYLGSYDFTIFATQIVCNLLMTEKYGNWYILFTNLPSESDGVPSIKLWKGLKSQ